MKTVAVIGCGKYMESGYGCPGEWRCLTAAARSDGNFEEHSQVIGLFTCECPGRTVAPNLGMAMKLSELKPDAIHLSSCMVKAKPGCPHFSPEQMAGILEEKTGIKVILGTHNYN